MVLCLRCLHAALALQMRAFAGGSSARLPLSMSEMRVISSHILTVPSMRAGVLAKSEEHQIRGFVPMKQIGYTMAGHVIETTEKLMKGKLGDTYAEGAFPFSHCLPRRLCVHMATRRRWFTAVSRMNSFGLASCPAPACLDKQWRLCQACRPCDVHVPTCPLLSRYNLVN